MNAYEIRIIKGLSGPMIFAAQMMSDFTAIRRAQMMADGPDAAFEVWRGMECIFKHGDAAPVR